MALLIRSQPNAWIHLLATIAVAAAGVYFDLARLEWGIVLLCMILVWMAEALNTSLEYLSDAVTEEINPLIGRAKDVAAAAVLIAAIGAVVIGLLVFLPHFLMERNP